MEPITLLGLGAAAVAAWKFLGDKRAQKEQGAHTPASDGGGTEFQPFGPSEQGAAWFAATGLQWHAVSKLSDNAAHTAQVQRGAALGDPSTNRITNDQSFRQTMASGMRLYVSTSLLAPTPGEPPYMLVAPSGFSASSVPTTWGQFRQLFAPPPGMLGGPMPPTDPGPVIPGPTPPTGDPFAEIPDASLRAQVREIHESDTIGLLALDATIAQLEKAGYKASAEALRQRRKNLAVKRQLEAQQRGGWLYVVRRGDTPFQVAQWYGGVRPGSLKELTQTNPDVSANNWKPGWQVGVEILLPGKWADPSLKAAPPTPSGPVSPKVPGLPQPQPSPGGGLPALFPFGVPPGDVPVPKVPRPGAPSEPGLWYGPNGEGPFVGPPPADRPPAFDEATPTAQQLYDMAQAALGGGK